MRSTLVLAAPLALALGVAAFAQTAAAQQVEPLTVYGHRLSPTQEIISTPVAYGDLNLTTYAGADIMLGRIRMAAKFICGTESANPMDRATLYRPCVDGITWQAVQEFANPLVAELNDRRGGVRAYAMNDEPY